MAGFLDKAKQAAQQALDEAKKGIDTGQAKLDEVQAKRESERLLTALGAAFYAEQRHGGSRDDVNAAMVALDTHVQTNGLVGFPSAAVVPAATEPPPAAPSPAPPPSPSPAPEQAPPEGGSAYDVPPPS